MKHKKEKKVVQSSPSHEKGQTNDKKPKKQGRFHKWFMKHHNHAVHLSAADEKAYQDSKAEMKRRWHETFHRSKSTSKTKGDYKAAYKSKYGWFVSDAFFYIWQFIKTIGITLIAYLPTVRANNLFQQIAYGGGGMTNASRYVMQGTQLRANLIAAGALLIAIWAVIFHMNWKLKNMKSCNPHIYGFIHSHFTSATSLVLGTCLIVAFIICALMFLSAVIAVVL